MRLIDADELKKKSVLLAGENDPVYAVPESEIDNMPTAYNLETVVRELHAEGMGAEKRAMRMKDHFALGEATAFSIAIAIVKRGGRNE